MEKQWNPVEEHIEGTLCERGLMTERFDFEKNDLVRSLTEKGREQAKDLLKSPEWKKEYLKLAIEHLKNQPLSIRKTAWKKIAEQLRD